MAKSISGGIVLATLVFSFGIPALGANVPLAQWAHQIGTSSDEGAQSVSVDGLGNVYVSGHTFGNLEGSINPPLAGYLRKYDSGGTHAWTRQFGNGTGEAGRDIAADALGNVFVSGVTTATFGGVHAGSWDGFVRKYDSTGSVAWTRQFGTSGTESPYDLAADGLGNVYVTGHTTGVLGSSSFGGYDAFLRKYDSIGNHVWTRQYGNSEGQDGLAVTADGNGAVYMAGSTAGTLAGSSAGGADAYLAKYDEFGTFQWARQLGSSAYDDCWGVASDAFGNVFIAGSTNGNLGGQNFGHRDLYVAKYDASGDLLWIRQWGSNTDEIEPDIAVDHLGNAFVVASTYGDMGGGIPGSGDPIVTKFDSEGSLLWTFQAGSAEFDGGRSISVDTDGGVYIAGETRSGSFFTLNAGGDDAFLIRIGEVPEPSGEVFLLIGLTLATGLRPRRT
jgi:hypothetical protein